jgi:S-adenosylmethionine hydrolase
MKGVILARCPSALLFDLTHGIPPQDVLAGALQLLAAAPYSPPDTVFLAVVDPGVGGARRPLCLRSGRRLFVGPDNGLLWPAAEACGVPEAFHLDRPEHWLPAAGATFHGRDVFAPAAAALAAGRLPEELGSPIEDPVRLRIPECSVSVEGVDGEVILIDGYGNAVTNVRPEDLTLSNAGSAVFSFDTGAVRGPSSHYEAAAPGEGLVVAGSLGFYEIAVNRGDAAKTFGLRVGSRIKARPAERVPSR